MKKIIVFSIIFSSLVIGNLVFAQNPQPLIEGETRQQMTNQENAFIRETGLQPVSLGQTIATIIRFLLSLLGLIFVILIIYAGMLWMTSAGNDDKIDKAKKIMSAAIIGLVIVLAAYAITTFVIFTLLQSSGLGTGEENQAGYAL